MIELIVFAGWVFGASWGIGFAHLSYGIRAWLAKRSPFLVVGLECIGCTSFHAGWIAFATGIAPSALHTWWQAALFASTSSLLIGKLTGVVNE